jgi:HEPN domain-containing protein
MQNHIIPFPNITFHITSIRDNPDLSMPFIAKQLHPLNMPEFQDDDTYAEWMLHSISYAFLVSAETLIKNMPHDKNVVAHEVIPSLFLCKHALELKLKHCLIVLGETNFSSHNVVDLWQKVIALHPMAPTYAKPMQTFIQEMHNLDNNEIALRYGTNQNLQPLQEDFVANSATVVYNTKCVFNVLHEEILHVALPVLF